MNYKQLTQDERYQIYILLKAEHNQSAIAQILNRSKSTISRKVSRNKGGRANKPIDSPTKCVKKPISTAR